MPKNRSSWIMPALSLALLSCGSGSSPTTTKDDPAAGISSSSSSSTGGQSGAGDQGSSGGQGVTLSALGAACTSDAECSGALCFNEQDKGWPSGFCTATCDLQQPTCQGSGKCFDTGQPDGLCVVPCTASGSECRDGYACLDAMGDGSLMICLPACSADAQCPTLGSCDPTQRICVSSESDCNNALDDDGDGFIDCEDPKSCQGSAACAAGNAATGHPCAVASDCAAGQGDPACLTEARFGFPSGYCSEFCDLEANDCGSPSTVCVHRKLQSGHGMCFLSCTADADCPTAGYQCADAGGGKRACLPGCTADSQCSGFCDLDSGFCNVADENCTDSMDNDGDARIDCEDRDCDATCGAQLTAACGGAIAAQASTAADTAGGSTLFSGSCTGSSAHEKIFTFTPGTAGQVGALTVSLSSTSDQGIYVRSLCGDGATELGCADHHKPGGPPEVLTIPVAGGVPVAIFVDGFSSSVAGPFTLDASFQQAICGDGTALVPEECDDGNTTTGDGCDASCHVEPVFYCAAPAPASVGDTQGDTTSGTSAFKGSCTGAGALERVYSYTPATSGILHVAVNSTTQQGFYIRTSCADATTEIACAEASFMGTETALDVPVHGGVPLTIVVDGHEAGAQAAFTLKLSLQ